VGALPVKGAGAGAADVGASGACQHNAQDSRLSGHVDVSAGRPGRPQGRVVGRSLWLRAGGRTGKYIRCVQSLLPEVKWKGRKGDDSTPGADWRRLAQTGAQPDRQVQGSVAGRHSLMHLHWLCACVVVCLCHWAMRVCGVRLTAAVVCVHSKCTCCSSRRSGTPTKASLCQ
jgi:hypothetical protein